VARPCLPRSTAVCSGPGYVLDGVSGSDGVTCQSQDISGPEGSTPRDCRLRRPPPAAPPTWAYRARPQLTGPSMSAPASRPFAASRPPPVGHQPPGGPAAGVGAPANQRAAASQSLAARAAPERPGQPIRSTPSLALVRTLARAPARTLRAECRILQRRRRRTLRLRVGVGGDLGRVDHPGERTRQLC